MNCSQTLRASASPLGLQLQELAVPLPLPWPWLRRDRVHLCPDPYQQVAPQELAVELVEVEVVGHQDHPTNVQQQAGHCCSG